MASPDQNPIANTYRSDFTHLTTPGGEIDADPIDVGLTLTCLPRTYPVAPVAGQTIPAFGGTGGVMSGAGVTGTVVDG